MRLAGVHADAELAQLLDAQVQPDKIPGGPHGKRPRETPRPKQQKKPRPDGPQPDRQLPDGPPPDDEAPQDEGPRDPEKPQAGHEPGKTPLPEIVKKHYIARPGYVNYYFNALNTDRVWRAMASRGDLSALAGTWTIRGTLASGGDFEIELSDKQSMLRIPGGETKIKLNRPPGRIAGSARQRWPVGRALDVAAAVGRRAEAVRRFVLLGDRAGARSSRPGRRAGRHVRRRGNAILRSIRATASCVELEMLPDDDADPCEVYFTSYHEVDGRMLPGRIEVRFGDGIYQVFACKQFQFRAAGGQ